MAAEESAESARRMKPARRGTVVHAFQCARGSHAAIMAAAAHAESARRTKSARTGYALLASRTAQGKYAEMTDVAEAAGNAKRGSLASKVLSAPMPVSRIVTERPVAMMGVAGPVETAMKVRPAKRASV